MPPSYRHCMFHPKVRTSLALEHTCHWFDINVDIDLTRTFVRLRQQSVAIHNITNSSGHHEPAPWPDCSISVRRCFVQYLSFGLFFLVDSYCLRGWPCNQSKLERKKTGEKTLRHLRLSLPQGVTIHTKVNGAIESLKPCVARNNIHQDAEIVVFVSHMHTSLSLRGQFCFVTKATTQKTHFFFRMGKRTVLL